MIANSLLLLGTLGSFAFAKKLPKIALKQVDDGSRVYIESDTGREAIFHGVNTVVKGFPWVPATDAFDIDTSLSTRDHEVLSDLGVNVYRLGSMWPGLEPTRGEYNSTYTAELRKIIKEAESFGVYTVLDMHQDVLSEKYCGEGVPSWAAQLATGDETTSFPAPLVEESEKYVDVASDGFPTRQDCSKFNWPQYYNTFDAGIAFQNIYTNVDGLLDAWGDFWKELAVELGSQEDAVLAYELINEPWSGDNMHNPKLFVPSVADRTYLQPAYDSLAHALRSVDNTTLIMFAAVTWDDIVPVGFDHAPGGEASGEDALAASTQSVFAYHYYNKPQFLPTVYFHQRVADAQRLQVGQMLTEFERANSAEAADEDLFVTVADHADQHLLSWTLWEYKTFCKETEETLASNSQAAAFGSCKTGYGDHNWLYNDDGSIVTGTAQRLARTYAQLTAGHVQNMKYDTSTGEFELIYQIDTSIEEPTVVFAHQELNYPDGMDVTIFPRNAVRMTHRRDSANELSNFLEFHSTRTSKNGESVRIKITRAVA